MARLSIRLPYTFTKQPDPERLAELAPLLDPTPALRADGQLGSYDVYQTSDIERVVGIVGAGVEIESAQTGALAWSVLLDRFEELAAAIKHQRPAFNDRVSVSVPGFALLAIRQVRIAQDYCTEQLQMDLNEGWSILAICPQPNQRRPDYILGKS